MILFQKSRKFTKSAYKLEDVFEKEVVKFQKLFFGPTSIYIEAKKKISTLSLGATIPDGFLFDMSDPDNREFYLVEVELASHDFYRHIFPQITKFFAFYKSKEKQKELVEKLFTIIDTDTKLKKQFKKYLGQEEIYKFLSDTVNSSQNILLVIDGEKPELPEIVDTYTDTWGKMVKVIVIEKFMAGNDIIYTLNPEFEEIAYTYPGLSSADEQPVDITEDYHLEGSTDKVRKAYNKIKAMIKEIDKSYIFNPQKYYISIKGQKNVAFLIIRKTKIRMVVLLPEEVIRENIKKHKVKSLSESVQKFYNAPCAEIFIDDFNNFREIRALLKHLINTTYNNNE